MFLCMSSCRHAVEQTASGEVLPDSLALLAQNEYEALLDEASDYANEAYYCNVDGEYELALQYIDSAMYCLNEQLQAIRPSYTSLYDADRRRDACGTGLVEPDVQFGFPCNSGYQE